jgi:exodeoxyribonuclease VII large subunit
MARNELTELAQHGAFARIQDLLGRRAQRLDELIYRLAGGFRESFRNYGRRLEVASARVHHFDLRRSLAATRGQLDSGSEALARAIRLHLREERGRLNQLAGKLEALSPMKILDRGYALVFDAEGNLVKDASRLAPGEQVTGRVARGSFTAEVKLTQKD